MVLMKKMLFACCVLIQILAFSACKEKENGWLSGEQCKHSAGVSRGKRI